MPPTHCPNPPRNGDVGVPLWNVSQFELMKGKYINTEDHLQQCNVAISQGHCESEYEYMQNLCGERHLKSVEPSEAMPGAPHKPRCRDTAQSETEKKIIEHFS